MVGFVFGGVVSGRGIVFADYRNLLFRDGYESIRDQPDYLKDRP